MKYSVKPNRTIEGDFVWSVYEKPTEQVIDSYHFEEEARKIKKHFESGGGFAGFTPQFMLTKVNNSVTIIPEDDEDVESIPENDDFVIFSVQ